jgi:hypothetical protein
MADEALPPPPLVYTQEQRSAIMTLPDLRTPLASAATWMAFSRDVRCHLNRRALGFILGDANPPQDVWLMFQGWMGLQVVPAFINMVMAATSPRDLWGRLNAQFAPAGSQHALSTHNDLVLIKQGDNETVCMYIQRARDYMGTLADLGQPVQELLAVTAVLRGVREQHFRDAADRFDDTYIEPAQRTLTALEAPLARREAKLVRDNLLTYDSGNAPSHPVGLFANASAAAATPAAVPEPVEEAQAFMAQRRSQARSADASLDARVGRLESRMDGMHAVLVQIRDAQLPSDGQAAGRGPGAVGRAPWAGGRGGAHAAAAAATKPWSAHPGGRLGFGGPGGMPVGGRGILATSGRGGVRACWICGSAGHVARLCPQRQQHAHFAGEHQDMHTDADGWAFLAHGDTTDAQDVYDDEHEPVPGAY